MNIREKLREQTSFRPPGAPFMLTFQGFVYKYVKYLLLTDNFKYVCKYGYNRHIHIEERCPAYLHVSFSIIKNDQNCEEVKLGEIIIKNGDHTCQKEKHLPENYIADYELKSRIEHIYLSQTPRPTQSQIITQLSKQLNDAPISDRIVYNTWAKLNKENKKKDDDFQDKLKTINNKNFELFKFRFSSFSEGKNSLIICYSSKWQQNLIDKSSYIFIDGTFSITPCGFSQVLVMLGRTIHMNIPICYMLLPNKEQKTYELAFTMFMTTVGKQFQNGTTFITDFEKGLANAVKKILMNETHIFQYCYFHYTQIMRRYFDKYIKFEHLDKLRQITNLFPFISEELLNDVLITLSNWEITDEFSVYFTKNFKNKYIFNDWNVYNKTNKQIITNNVAESHNSKLSKRIKDNPTLENFEDILKEIEDEDRLRYESKEINNLEINRIDNDTFLEIFNNFISDLQRSGYTKKVPNNERKSVNSNFFFEYTNVNNQIPRKESIDKEDNCEDVQEIIELETNKNLRFINKASTYNRMSIRKMQGSAHEILKEHLVFFKEAPERSSKRKSIIIECFNKVHEIEPGVELNQIKSWFNNNKNKS